MAVDTLQSRRWLYAQTRQARRALVLAVALGWLEGFAVIAQAFFLSQIIHALFIEARPRESLAAAFASFAAAVVVRAALAWLKEISAFSAGERVRAQVRQRLLDRITARGPGFTRGERTGALTSVWVEQIEGLQDFYALYLPELEWSEFAQSFVDTPPEGDEVESIRRHHAVLQQRESSNLGGEYELRTILGYNHRNGIIALDLFRNVITPNQEGTSVERLAFVMALDDPSGTYPIDSTGVRTIVLARSEGAYADSLLLAANAACFHLCWHFAMIDVKPYQDLPPELTSSQEDLMDIALLDRTRRQLIISHYGDDQVLKYSPEESSSSPPSTL